MKSSQLRNSIHGSLQRCGLLLVSLVLACFAFSPTVQAYTFIEFDTPGFQNTFPQDINVRGTIVGFARSPINTGPAFVRGPNGDITTLEFPGSQRAVARYQRVPTSSYRWPCLSSIVR